MPERIAITAGTMRDADNEVCRRLKELGYELAIHPHPRAPNREEQRALMEGVVGIIAGSEPITREVLLAADRARRPSDGARPSRR